MSYTTPGNLASASVTRDLTNRDQLGILAKRIRLFVVRVVVLGTDPAQPPIIRRAPVSLDDMRGSSPFIAAPLDLAPHAVRATRTHELLVQVAYLVPFITRSMDVLHHGAVVVVVRHSPIFRADRKPEKTERGAVDRAVRFFSRV